MLFGHCRLDVVRKRVRWPIFERSVNLVVLVDHALSAAVLLLSAANLVQNVCIDMWCRMDMLELRGDHLGSLRHVD